MRVGDLDTPIRFERPVATEDSEFGGNVGSSWETVWTTWGQLSDITTRMQEETKQDLRLLKRPCRLKVRYNPNIDATMRVVVLDRDDRILQIVSKPAELGRKEALEMMCEDYSQ
jgi:head-tail adaptor